MVVLVPEEPQHKPIGIANQPINGIRIVAQQQPSIALEVLEEWLFVIESTLEEPHLGHFMLESFCIALFYT